MEETIKLWFKEGYTDFDSSEGLNRDRPFELKRLNVIVGANNSGKSRFMRKFANESHSGSMYFRFYKEYITLINDFNELIEQYSTKHSIKLDIKSLYNSTYIEAEIDKTGAMISNLKNKLEPFIDISRPNFEYNSLAEIVFKHNDKNSRRLVVENLEKLVNDISSCKSLFAPSTLKMLKIFYIDSLRSLKKIQHIVMDSQTEESKINLSNQPLLLRTYLDYGFPKDQIVSGEDFFEFLTDSLLGMPEERQRIDDYQAKLSHYFFNNEVITLIPHRKDDSLHIKIGEAKQFPISQLGDGLQQVIILTYKAFLITEPSFFFIEEPEMHLHAGYVKQVMKFLLNETDHYYMATSHSNYLLDMINEDKRIALYRVDKEQMNDEENKYETVIKRCDGDRTILKTLGVSPSSVFLANCTIWIEGITDRLYFVQYLKKYLEELKTTDEEKWKDYSRFIDGYHYAFVEYQGSNLDHWDFEVDCPDDVNSSSDKGLPALLTTSHALVVADADLRGKPRFTELQSQLNDNMIITQGKETENTLPTNLLKKKFFSMCPENGLSRQGRKKKLEHLEEYDEYFDNTHETSDLGIGDYLDNILETMRADKIVPDIPEDKSSFIFSEGGQKTIKEKTIFCRDIITLMENEDWNLTDSAKQICEKIFEHIEKNNN